VFVSYSQPDRDTAQGLVAHLEAQAVPCWVAPRDVTPGLDWAEAIVDAIGAARVMLLVFSSSANCSPQVRREVERAVYHRVTVLPFRVEDILPSKSLEYFLSSQHWLDAFPPPMEPHYARLCAYLKALLASGSAGASAGTAPAPARVEAPSAAAERMPSPATLAHLEAERARYLGPVARVLVNRAARRFAGLDALILDLGAEIDSETERRQFINVSRQSLHGRS
jgi:hypothetical protein